MAAREQASVTISEALEVFSWDVSIHVLEFWHKGHMPSLQG